MPVDPSIPLSFRPTNFGVPKTSFNAEDRIRLQSLVEQTQLRQLQIQDERRQMQERDAVQQVYRNPAYFAPDGSITLAGIRALDIAAPGTGQKAQITQQNEAFRKLQADQASAALGEHRTKTMNEIRDKAVAMTTPFAEQVKTNPALVQRKFRENYQTTFDEYRKSGRLVGIPEQDWDAMRNQDLDYYAKQAEALGPKAAIEEPRKAAEQESKLTARERAADERDRSYDLRVREFNLAKQREEFNEKVKQEAKDRPDRFRNRMIQAGNLAVGDIQNVVKLPITTSRGYFGGRQQGKGILAASAETLTNKVTSEDAQLYNVMYSGLQRNLATIEATGLAQQGTLTHLMANLDIKEGDTQLTKLSKLAQVKQIVVRGLEDILTEPGVPQSQKDQINKIVQDFNKAVPWTQDDIIAVKYGKNPRLTLGDAMRARKGKVSTTDAPQKPETVDPAWDDAAEKRLQELEEWDRKRRAK